MKILYTDMHFLDSGHQIKAYPASVGPNANTDVEKDVFKRVDEIKVNTQKMFADFSEEKVIPPLLGDVIWTMASNNMWYATCIVYDEDGVMNWEAVKLCMHSIRKKCDTLDQQEVGMTVFGSELKENFAQWQEMYPLIEEIFKETAQVVCYIPDIYYLADIVESLSGTVKKIIPLSKPRIVLH